MRGRGALLVFWYLCCGSPGASAARPQEALEARAERIEDGLAQQAVGAQEVFEEEFRDCMAKVYGGTGWGVPASPKTTRNYGQDRELHVQAPDACLFAVFDGHGPRGHEVAADAARFLRRRFLDRGMRTESEVRRALAYVSEELQKTPAATDSGSTVAGLVRIPSTDLVLVFHAGDSRVVWYNDVGEVLGETQDHDCEHPEEVKHIRHACDGLYMPCTDDYAVMTLRSLGDAQCQGARLDGMYNSVDVQTVNHNKRAPPWLILASDGIFGSVQQLGNGQTQQIGFASAEAMQYILDEDNTPVKSRIEDMFRLSSTFSPKQPMLKGRALNFYGPGDDMALLVVRLLSEDEFASMPEAEGQADVPAVADAPESELAPLEKYAAGRQDVRRLLDLVRSAKEQRRAGDANGAVLDLHEALGSSYDTIARWHAWMELGSVYSSLGNSTMALKAYENSVQELERSKIGLASAEGMEALEHVAQTRKQRGDFVEALKAFRRLTEVQERAGMTDTIKGAAALVNLADLEAQVGGGRDAQLVADAGRTSRRARDALAFSLPD